MTRRVLMTVDAVGGVWPYALELCRALTQQNVAVLLAATGPEPSASQKEAVRALANVRFEHRPFALESMPHSWTDIRRAGDWLLELETGFQPDVIHLNDYCNAVREFKAPRLVVAHSCVCSWWEAVHGTRASGVWAKYRRRVRAGLRAADAIVSPSRWMLAQLERHYGGITQGVVVPNARSADGLQPAEKEPVVLAAGRVGDEAKNFLALDRAANGLAWPVMIAGPTDAAKGTLESSRLLGELDPTAVAQWLGRAGIFVLPAKYEPSGLTVLEAALSGCALVLGDIASLHESWEGAALFVDPRDPAAIKAGLARVIADRKLRDELAASALERARRFVPGAQVDAYLTTYASVSRRAACAS